MTGWEPSKWLRVIQTSPFLRKWTSLGLTEDDLLVLEQEILKSPERCPVVKGTNGLRKIRFASPGHGKRQERRLSSLLRLLCSTWDDFPAHGLWQE